MLGEAEQEQRALTPARIELGAELATRLFRRAFCFAAFALASLSVVAVLPILSRVSQLMRILIVAMLVVTGWEFITATRVLLYQF